jgi:hypothetical protein
LEMILKSVGIGKEAGSCCEGKQHSA